MSAGNIEALQFLEMNYKDFNLRRVKRLPVSGAFHTDLMQPAVDPLRQVMKGMTINRPRMLVFSNVTGYRYLKRLYETIYIVVGQVL